MDFIANHSTLLLTLACIFGFFMAWGIGANDIANAIGTSVGAKILTIKQAILIACIFEFAGAFLAGGQVASTIKNDIVDISNIDVDIFILGMISSLLASGIWLLVASIKGWPVSTTHTIVGAIVGFALSNGSYDSIYWSKLLPIVSSWIFTPFLAAVVAFTIFTSIQKLIFNTDSPFSSAKKYAPFYIFITGFVLSFSTLTKGLESLKLGLESWQSFFISVFIGLFISAIGIFILRKIQEDTLSSSLEQSEKIFGILMVFTACSMAFAHGANDVSNAIGPVAAVVSVIQEGATIGSKAPVSIWVLFLGAFGILVGLITYGWRVIATIGKSITELTASRGFSAELSAAIVVILASTFGFPISTTHTLIGAILGIGFARGIEAINLSVVAKIFSSWVVTLPAGAILAAIILKILTFLI